MNITARFFAVGALLAIVGSAGASAHETTIGALTISSPFTRATPPGAPVGGGYMTITNSGTEADRLIGGSTDFADAVEIHRMIMDGDVIKMRRVEDGLEIPAGGEVVLKPGGLHLMFRKLNEPLRQGETHTVRLMFEKAGEVEVEFTVERLGATAAGAHRHK